MEAVETAFRNHHEALLRPKSAGERPNVRRSGSFVTMPNFKFSQALEEAGAKQEESVTMEERRLQLKKFMTHSKIGKYYENFVLLLSLISCFEYIYETYLHKSVPEDQYQLHVLKNLELVFATIFAVDWSLNLFLAEHRVLYFTRYLLSLTSYCLMYTIFYWVDIAF